MNRAMPPISRIPEISTSMGWSASLAMVAFVLAPEA